MLYYCYNSETEIKVNNENTEREILINKLQKYEKEVFESLLLQERCCLFGLAIILYPYPNEVNKFFPSVGRSIRERGIVAYHPASFLPVLRQYDPHHRGEEIDILINTFIHSAVDDELVTLTSNKHSLYEDLKKWFYDGNLQQINYTHSAGYFVRPRFDYNLSSSWSYSKRELAQLAYELLTNQMETKKLLRWVIKKGLFPIELLDINQQYLKIYLEAQDENLILLESRFLDTDYYSLPQAISLMARICREEDQPFELNIDTKRHKTFSKLPDPPERIFNPYKSWGNGEWYKKELLEKSLGKLPPNLQERQQFWNKYWEKAQEAIEFGDIEANRSKNKVKLSSFLKYFWEKNYIFAPTIFNIPEEILIKANIKPIKNFLKLYLEECLSKIVDLLIKNYEIESFSFPGTKEEFLKFLIKIEPKFNHISGKGSIDPYLEKLNIKFASGKKGTGFFQNVKKEKGVDYFTKELATRVQVKKYFKSKS